MSLFTLFGFCLIHLFITSTVALRSIHPGKILIAGAFDNMIIFCVPSEGDLCLPIAHFFFVLTVPRVSYVVFDSRDGGGGDLHVYYEGSGRSKLDIVESVSATACSTASSLTFCFFYQCVNKKG